MRNISIRSITLASALVLAGLSGTALANESEQKKEVEATLKQQISQQREAVSAELQQQLQESVKLALVRFAPELSKTVLAKNN